MEKSTNLPKISDKQVVSSTPRHERNKSDSYNTADILTTLITHI